MKIITILKIKFFFLRQMHPHSSFYPQRSEVQTQVKYSSQRIHGKSKINSLKSFLFFNKKKQKTKKTKNQKNNICIFLLLLNQSVASECGRKVSKFPGGDGVGGQLFNPFNPFFLSSFYPQTAMFAKCHLWSGPFLFVRLGKESLPRPL